MPLGSTSPSPHVGDAPSATASGGASSPPTRRQVLAGAAVAGAAAAAGGVAFTAPAAASPRSRQRSGDGTDTVVAHVCDARAGIVDMYVGERHVRVRDADLAQRLADASR
jgi:hypothetical protein